MPFFKRFPLGLQADADSDLDSSFLQDDRLVQARQYWKNMWLYNVSNDEYRRVSDFRHEQNRLVPEFDFTTTPSTTDIFEILSIFTPDEIHDAIDDAIREGFPTFFDVVTDESMIYEQDKISYDLVNVVGGRGVLTNPLRIKKLWIEQATTGTIHLATSGAAGTITDANATFTAVDTSWRVSIFKGTGSGQTQLVASGDDAGILTPIANWTVTPDSSSRFRVWDASLEVVEWRDLAAVKFDAKDYPTNMYMAARMPSWYGMRFRIQYIGEPQVFTNDSAPTTVVPTKYIKHYAMSVLFDKRARSHPSEQTKFGDLADREMVKADKYKIEHGFDLPDQTWWTEDDPSIGFGSTSDIFDPLGHLS